MLKENRCLIHNSIKNFLIFTAFFLVLYFYQKTIRFDRLYVLVIAQSIVLVIYLISIYRIKIGFYIFIFLIPLLSTLSNMYGIRRMNIIFLFFLSLFLGFMVNRFESEEGFIYETELARPVFIFLLILALSTVITIFRYSNFYPFITTKFHNLTVNFTGHDSIGAILWTLKYFFYYIAGFALLFIIFNIIKTRRDFIISLIILLSTCPIVMAVGFYQKFINPRFGTNTFWLEAGRINSTFTDPNALGGYIIILFPLLVSLIIYFNKWYLKIAAGLFLAMFIYFSFLCGSRSAFTAIIIASGLFIIVGLSIALRYFLKKKIKRPDKSALLSAGIILLLLIVVSSSLLGILAKTGILENIDEFEGTGIILADRVIETIRDFYTALKTEGFRRAYIDISSGREILWRQAYYMFKDHPVSGVGQAAYFIELSDYHRRYHRGFHILDFTGNYYLQILSELGLVGIILVLFIFFLIAKKPVRYLLSKNRNRKLKKEDWLFAGFAISFFVMLAALFFGPHTNFIEVQFLFWLAIGLMLAYINISSGGKIAPEAAGYNSADDAAEPDTGSGSVVKQQETKTGTSSIDASSEDNTPRAGLNKYLCTGSFRKIEFDLISKIILILIIIVFGITLLISSATDLSINIKQTLYKWENYYGFYNEEVIDGQEIRWTSIDAIEVMNKKGEKLIVPVRDADPVEHRLPLFIRFYINNRLVKVIKIDDRKWHDIEIDLSWYKDERFTFTMACSRSWVPKEWGLSMDSRELGVITGKFKFLN
jgi:putative inorganic carbon (hco3(-)) transporter